MILEPIKYQTAKISGTLPWIPLGAYQSRSPNPLLQSSEIPNLCLTAKIGNFWLTLDNHCFVFKILKFLWFYLIQKLQNLWCHHRNYYKFEVALLIAPFFMIGIHSMQGWTATTRHGFTRKRTCGVLVITTAQLNSTRPGLRFCAGSNSARGVSEIRDGENLR